jgi:succinate-acetate transporter protein
MTATDISSPTVVHAVDPAQNGQAAAVSVASPAAMLGFPAFSISAFALALFLTGFNQTTIPSTMAAPLPIMILSGVLLLISSVWAARRGEGVYAAIFGLFGAFWLSFCVLILGLLDNWFTKLPEPAQRGANANFLLIWFVLMTVVTLATLRMQLIYTVMFILIDISLITLFAAVSIARPGAGGDPFILHPGVLAIFALPFVAMYIFASHMNQALGGKSFRMGKPLVKKR